MVAVLDRERIRSKAAASHETGGSGGGSVDDTQKRLTAVETTQAETKIILQGLVSKETFERFRGEVLAMFEKISGRLGAIEVQLPSFATKADINRLEGSAKTDIARVEGAIEKLHASMIKWVVGTGITCMALALGFARVFG